MSQLQEGIDQLHTLLTTSGNTPAAVLAALGEPVVAVYDYEPEAKGLPRPLAISLSPGDPAMDATQVMVRLRIYADPSALGASGAQAAVIETMETVDGMLADEFGKAPWQYGYSDELAVFVGFCDLPFLRDDIST